MKKISELQDRTSTLLSLGRMVREGRPVELLMRTLEKLHQWEEPTSQLQQFNHISQSFALNQGEELLLCGALDAFVSKELFWTAKEMITFLNRFEESGKEEISFLFDTEKSLLLRTACSLMLERTPTLPSCFEVRIGGEQLLHSKTLLNELESFLGRCEAEDNLLPAFVSIVGKAGSGKRFLATELAYLSSHPLLLVDSGAVADEDIVLIAGLALLFGGIVCLENYQSIQHKIADGLLDWFSVVLTVSEDSVAAPSRARSHFIRKMGSLSWQERYTIMEYLFPNGHKETWEKAAKLYRMNMGELVNSAARYRAEGGNTEIFPYLWQENLPALSRNAELLRIEKPLEELVLAEEAMEQVRRLCEFAKVRDTVWNEWGFGEKIPYGRGLTALFYGASGTGKTLAAGMVANELGLPLYRVDLSQLISKYIGETQKNISRIFDDAKNSDCILFFDEADALFARRGEASDAQDRYANAETAYLLQRTEQHEGIILMATNLLQNFDEAFRRRIDFMIHFSLPDVAMRERLWRGIFPENAPLDGIDFSALAENLELSGAGIRNCALGAAQLAAAQRGRIDMPRILEAARREYHKMGKPFPTRLSILFP